MHAFPGVLDVWSHEELVTQKIGCLLPCSYLLTYCSVLQKDGVLESCGCLVCIFSQLPIVSLEWGEGASKG